MPVTTIRNPDGSVTYRDNTTGATRTVKNGTVVSQNYRDPLSQQSGIKYVPDGSGADQRVRDYNASLPSPSRSSGSSGSRSVGGGGYSESDLQRLIDSMRPAPLPSFDFSAAQSSIMRALQPLIESSQDAIARQYSQGLRALQAHQAATGIGGDPAARAFQRYDDARARAINELGSVLSSQAIDQALALAQAQQGQYATQAQLESDAIRNAINAFQALSNQQLGSQGQWLDHLLGRMQLEEGARQANLPYVGATQDQLINLLMAILGQNPYGFNNALQGLI